MSFTFLNATGAPALSHEETKQMRAHITRTNFAKRRQRLAKARKAPGPPIAAISDGGVIKYWAMIDDRSPRQGDPVAWVAFLLSDPVLVESVMAAGMSLADFSQSAGEAHLSRASSMIIERIALGSVYADSMLAAVFTLALHERIQLNEAAWNIHIQGLAQLIGERYARGVRELPVWLLELIIIDAVNYVLDFPRIYSHAIIHAISRYGYGSVQEVAAISEWCRKLRRLVQAQHDCRSASSSMAVEIDNFAKLLLKRIRILQQDSSPAIQAAAWAFHALCMMWWRPQSLVENKLVAASLEDSLCRLQLTPCAYLELTSSQLLIGVVSARKDAETRAWFVDRLRNALASISRHRWATAPDILRILIEGMGAAPIVVECLQLFTEVQV